MKVLGIKEIPVSKIEVIQGLLPRVETHTVEDKVEEYKEAMEMGAEFPPITVWLKNNEYWLIDGMHRLLATKRLGKKTIKAEVVELKDMLEAKIVAITKNRHGLPLTKQEKKILCQNLYMEGVPVPELMKIFGVSERTIYYWVSGLKAKEKEELKERAKELKEQGHSLREIESSLGIDHTTASRWLNDTENLQEYSNEGDDEISYDKLMKIVNNAEISKQASEYTQQKFEEERRKSNGGRPSTKEIAATEEEYERIKNGLVYEMEKIALRIGWAKALQIFEEALKEIKEI
ncbi:MAG: helix-turn-helix domain-containing protein, partial [Sulfurihydrogenibium sp.]|nr:helix-turn-helix domain-containing protein [Sulfurihydrogenibium sp.]